jgi:hypothetical protein
MVAPALAYSLASTNDTLVNNQAGLVYCMDQHPSSELCAYLPITHPLMNKYQDIPVLPSYYSGIYQAIQSTPYVAEIY